MLSSQTLSEETLVVEAQIHLSVAMSQQSQHHIFLLILNMSHNVVVGHKSLCSSNLPIRYSILLRSSGAGLLFFLFISLFFCKFVQGT